MEEKLVNIRHGRGQKWSINFIIEEKMVEIRGYRDSKGSFARWFIIAIVHFLDGSVRRVNEKMDRSR